MDRNFRLQNLLQVPADGFPFAIFIGREIKVLGFLQQFLQFRDVGLLILRHHINGREAIVHIDAQLGPFLIFQIRGHLFFALWQVTDMANTGLHRITLAQEFADRAGLRRRLDDDERVSFAGCGCFLGHDIPVVNEVQNLASKSAFELSRVLSRDACWHRFQPREQVAHGSGRCQEGSISKLV